MWFWIVVLGALLFRMAVLVRSQFVISFDEAHFLRLAGSVSERGIGGLLHPYWPPFYPACIALLNGAVRNLEWAGRLVNVAAGTFLIVLVYRIAMVLFGRREALFSALVLAFAPPVAWNSTTVMSDGLYSLLGIGGMVFGWMALTRNRWQFFALTGIVWAAAYLTKPEAVGFLAVYVPILMLVGMFSRKPKVQRRLAWNAAVMTACFVAVSSPYWLYLHRATGKWTLSTKGMVNQQLEAAVLLDIGGMKDPFFHLTSDNRYLPYDMAHHFGNLQDLLRLGEGKERVVRMRGSAYAVKFVKNFYRVEKNAIPQLFGLVLLVLCSLGLFSSLYDRRRLELVLYLLSFVAFFWFVLVPLFHVNERYLAALFPVCLVWAGRGMAAMQSWVSMHLQKAFASSTAGKRRLHRVAWLGVLGWILVFYFLPEIAKVVSVRKYDNGMWSQPVEMKEVGIWLKRHTPHPPALMSLNKAADFYAGQYNMKMGASFSYDSVERNMAYARFRGVEYVVFSSRYLEWFPNLKPLLDDPIPSPGMERVFVQTDPGGILTVAYRLMPENREGRGENAKTQGLRK